MNKGNLKKLISHLKKLEEKPYKDVGFNMDLYITETSSAFDHIDKSGNTCGTVACIAGHATLLAVKMEEHKVTAQSLWDQMQTYNFTAGLGKLSLSVKNIAADFLGLNEDQAFALFCAEHPELPGSVCHTLTSITLSEAIETLEKLLKTGKIDWSHIYTD